MSPLQKQNILEYIGHRLRNIREQQHLSLKDVEVKSDGKWKTSIMGFYERGNRSISIAKLKELSDFYGAPIHWFLPTSTNIRS